MTWRSSVRKFPWQPAYPTPTGLFHVIAKQVNPSWSVPNSSWAGSLGGSTIPGGSPDNPLKARWIGITGSVGFHGTGDLWSLGSNASHGCVRMRVPDVINLYRRVHIGTPVYIRSRAVRPASRGAANTSRPPRVVVSGRLRFSDDGPMPTTTTCALPPDSD